MDTRAPGALRFDAGRLCLDLLATAHPAERLDTVPRLRSWCNAAGLVPYGTPLHGAGPDWLTAFRELRGHIGLLVRAELDGRSAATALQRVNLAAREAPPVLRAVRMRDGSLSRDLPWEPALGALLALPARDAVDLLTDPVARAGLRRCAGDDCPLIYLDTSRGHRRRWCSSEACGNRERVARHRRRVTRAAHAAHG